MSVAYLIRAHHKPVELARLVERLTTDNASVYVHVDARASAKTYAAMRRKLGNVHWVERVPARYAGFSLVRSMLAGLADIASAEPMPTHTVFLSGQDYPLRPAPEIEQALAGHPGESLVEHFPIPDPERWADDNGGLDRIAYWYFERVRYRTRILRLPLLRRSFPRGLKPYGGSAWCVLSDEAVRTLLDFPAERPDAFRFFAHAKMPDEIFTQTVLLNSPAGERVLNESTHYVDWPGGSHPATFRRDDFPRLAGSGKLFARKFDVDEDAEILDLIDRELLATPREASQPAG